MKKISLFVVLCMFMCINVQAQTEKIRKNPINSDLFYTISGANGLCLDIKNLDNETKITQSKPNGTDTQLWKFKKEGEKGFRIISKANTNKCISVDDEQFMIIYDVTDADQFFKTKSIVNAPNKIKIIVTSNDMALSVKKEDTEGAAVYEVPANTSKMQSWTITPEGQTITENPTGNPVVITPTVIMPTVVTPTKPPIKEPVITPISGNTLGTIVKTEGNVITITADISPAQAYQKFKTDYIAYRIYNKTTSERPYGVDYSGIPTDCTPGKINPNVITAFNKQLNAIRWLAGVDDLTAIDAKMQATTMLNTQYVYRNKLDEKWDFHNFTAPLCNTYEKPRWSWHSGYMMIGLEEFSAIASWANDFDEPTLGHRWSIIQPSLDKHGIGIVYKDIANVISTLWTSNKEDKDVKTTFYAYPSWRGIPVELDIYDWSLSLAQGLGFQEGKTKVTLRTKSGKNIKIEKQWSAFGHVAFRPDRKFIGSLYQGFDLGDDGFVEVTVTDVMIAGKLQTVKYTVPILGTGVSGIINNSYMMLEQPKFGKFLMPNPNNQQEGSEIQLYSNPTDKDNALWKTSKQTDGSYTFQHKKTGLYLGTATKTQGASVTLVSTPTQWEMVKGDATGLRLKGTNQCIDLYYGKNEEGNKVTLFVWDKVWNQVWNFKQ